MQKNSKALLADNVKWARGNASNCVPGKSNEWGKNRMQTHTLSCFLAANLDCHEDPKRATHQPGRLATKLGVKQKSMVNIEHTIQKEHIITHTKEGQDMCLGRF